MIFSVNRVMILAHHHVCCFWESLCRTLLTVFYQPVPGATTTYQSYPSNPKDRSANTNVPDKNDDDVIRGQIGVAQCNLRARTLDMNLPPMTSYTINIPWWRQHISAFFVWRFCSDWLICGVWGSQINSYFYQEWVDCRLLRMRWDGTLRNNGHDDVLAITKVITCIILAR